MWGKSKVPPHIHTWKVTGVKYVTTNYAPTSLRGPDTTRILREIMYGFTNITQQCTECGWVDVQKHVGKVDVPGFVWK